MDFELTKEEKSAISRLKSLAKVWPDSLWLFSGNGSLHVMRKNENGEHAADDGGCIDPDYVLDTIFIENDGGDW